MEQNKINNSNKTKLFILTLLVLLVSVAGISYAYFTIQITGNDTASSMRLRTANMQLVYNDVQIVSGEYATPGWTDTKTFTVTNTGNVDADYIIKFRELVNTIINGELVLSATCSASSGSCSNLPERAVHAASTEITDAYMYGPITIAPGVTHTYTLTALFKETGSNQNYNQNKYFNGTLNIGDGTATDESIFSYTISNNEVTITGFNSSAVQVEVDDMGKCETYWQNLNGNHCGWTPNRFCSNPTSSGCGKSIVSEVLNGRISDYDAAGLIVNNKIPRNLIIPSSINGKMVTAINSNAFNQKGLTSAIIPDSVTTIGTQAFRDNQLTSVVIPSSVTSIASSAFHLNSLTSIVIPNSVTSIGGSAFNCNDIESLVISNSVTAIGESAFYNNELTSITIPNSVTTIGGMSFGYNQLTSVEIPDSVTSIGMSAFESNQLTSVVIPNSVTSIGDGVFNNNLLPDSQAFIYKRTDTNNDGVAEIDTTTLMSYGGAKKDVIIPSNVIIIYSWAFGNAHITSVVIPSSVTSIEQSAFANNQLISVTIEGKTSSSDFTTYNPSWYWASSQYRTCTVTDNTCNVEGGCITWLGSGS